MDNKESEKILILWWKRRVWKKKRLCWEGWVINKFEVGI